MVNKKVKEFLNEKVEGMVESHIDCWKERYLRKSIESIEYDLRVNHDFSGEYEYVNDSLKVKLTDDDKNYIKEEFIEYLVNNYYQS